MQSVFALFSFSVETLNYKVLPTKFEEETVFWFFAIIP